MSEEIKNNNIVEDQVEKNSEKPHAILIIMGLIMVAVYMGMSFLLLFTTLFQGVIPAWARYLMGIVFFVYGIFRGYRVYKSHK